MALQGQPKGNAAMLKVVSPLSISHQDVPSHLDEIARLGARRMLMEALDGVFWCLMIDFNAGVA